MHGDFSRLTYTTAPLDTDGGFAAVLGLQGRLMLESDANENVAILAHFLRSLVTDLVGPGAGPAADPGFKIAAQDKEGKQNLLIGSGHYYVGGLLVQTTDTNYHAQPGRPPADSADDFTLPKGPALVYLKVWERLITALEDPRIREVALGTGGADTAARSKVVWEVVMTPLTTSSGSIDAKSREEAMSLWTEFTPSLSPQRGQLQAMARTEEGADELCAMSPGSQYRGVENQLYRVEIHGDGDILSGEQEAGSKVAAPTFKWSRDNGSVVFAIETQAGATVTVSTLGRDDRLALRVGHCVEVGDDRYVLAGRPLPLRVVVDVNPDERLVTLDQAPAGDVGEDPALHPFLRRWDHSANGRALASDNALAVDSVPGTWMELEDGVRVAFGPGHYRSGDYWTIPARWETGDVIWPAKDGQPAAREPQGITYFYTPLAYVDRKGQATFDLRCIFPTLGCISAEAADLKVETESATGPARSTARRRRAKPGPS